MYYLYVYGRAEDILGLPELFDLYPHARAAAITGHPGLLFQVISMAYFADQERDLIAFMLVRYPTLVYRVEHWFIGVGTQGGYIAAQNYSMKYGPINAVLTRIAAQQRRRA